MWHQSSYQLSTMTINKQVFDQFFFLSCIKKLSGQIIVESCGIGVLWKQREAMHDKNSEKNDASPKFYPHQVLRKYDFCIWCLANNLPTPNPS
jgi:hypothetical protein